MSSVRFRLAPPLRLWIAFGDLAVEGQDYVQRERNKVSDTVNIKECPFGHRFLCAGVHYESFKSNNIMRLGVVTFCRGERAVRRA